HDRDIGMQSRDRTVAGAPTLLGVFDFTYQHYALGDLLTCQVDLAVMAIEQGCRGVDVIAMVNPDLPSARLQSFITRDNSTGHLDNIMSVLRCNPWLEPCQGVRAVQAFNFLIDQHRRSGARMWPDLKTHLEMRQGFPIAPQRINAFNARHGHFPKLATPRG